MHASTDSTLCPVRSWARVVRRILASSKASQDTFVNTYYIGEKQYFISSADVTKALRAAAVCTGETKLGFKAGEIGTHSLRSGAAMAMYLAEVPIYTIMLIGRWSSDAFLLYIRKQVEQFSHNVSSRMVQHVDFTHVPAYEPGIHSQDPRTRNNRNNAQTRYNMGRSASHIIPTLPSFSLFK